MNIYQDHNTLLWVLEMKFRDGNWYRCGAYGSQVLAGKASGCLIFPGAVRIDGPSYNRG